MDSVPSRLSLAELLVYNGTGGGIALPVSLGALLGRNVLGSEAVQREDLYSMLTTFVQRFHFMQTLQTCNVRALPQVWRNILARATPNAPASRRRGCCGKRSRLTSSILGQSSQGRSELLILPKGAHMHAKSSLREERTAQQVRRSTAQPSLPSH